MNKVSVAKKPLKRTPGESPRRKKSKKEKSTPRKKTSRRDRKLKKVKSILYIPEDCFQGKSSTMNTNGKKLIGNTSQSSLIEEEPEKTLKTIFFPFRNFGSRKTLVTTSLTNIPADNKLISTGKSLSTTNIKSKKINSILTTLSVQDEYFDSTDVSSCDLRSRTDLTDDDYKIIDWILNNEDKASMSSKHHSFISKLKSNEKFDLQKMIN